VHLVSKALIALVAIEHLYILVLEAFFWTSPRALKVFGMSLEVAEASEALAINQGIYNGFLMAGLVWALLHANIVFARQIATFFLSCVVIAAIAGGLIAKPSIFLVQGAPAILALLSLWLMTTKASKSLD